MIVLDEHLDDLKLETAIAHWYGGKVTNIKMLRSGTIIKDDAIPTILRQSLQPTFVTIDWTDFWRKFPADKRYCIICFPLSGQRTKEIPDLLRQILKLKQFNTKASRMGMVIRVTKTSVHYYHTNDPRTYILSI